MLNFLDILIGFASIMLGASLIVTVLNQVVSAAAAHRGGNLVWGLRTLFQQVDPGALGLPVLTHYASDLAETVATHPLVSDSIFSTSWAMLTRKHPLVLRVVRRWQFASAMEVSELRETLQHIADKRPPEMSAVRHRLLAADIRSLLGAGKTLDQWFATMQDRIKQRFTMWMRMWTVVFALLVAGAGCLDTFAAIEALNTQADTRTKWAAAAVPLSAIEAKATSGPVDTQTALGLAGKVFDQFAGAKLDGIGWNAWSTYQKRHKELYQVLGGVLTSWLLICLGAPFWFNALGSLTSLRPVLAEKT